MKNRVAFCVAIVSLLAMACGGAPTEPVASPEPVVAPPPPPPSEPAPVEQAPIQRVASTDAQRKCTISPEEDGTNMVVCDEHDWFLYAPQAAQVDCGKFGGNVVITEGPMVVTIKPLFPSGATGKEAEEQLRQQAVGFIRSNLASEYGSGGDLSFTEAKIGRFKRPALWAEADLDLKGTPGKVVACITSKTNNKDEVIVHRTVWVGPADLYDAKATPKKVKETAANWHRYSDTNGMGKVIQKW